LSSSSFLFLSRVDLEQLHLEDEGLVGQWPTFTMGQVGWNEKLPVGFFFHEPQGLRPAADDGANAKHRCLAATV